MIKLDIHEYCHTCLEFESLVAQTPVQIKAGTKYRHCSIMFEMKELIFNE